MRQVIQAGIEKGVEIFSMLLLIVYSTGWTLGMTIPMSALLAVIMGVGTMNGDNEIIAMRAGGIHFFRIFRPYLVMGTLFVIPMLWFHITIVPYCYRQLMVVVAEIYQYNPTAAVVPGQFALLDVQKNIRRHIYVEKISREAIEGENELEVLHNIQIRKSENINGVYSLTESISAKKGMKVIKNSETGEQVKALRLYNGYILTRDVETGNMQRINFTGDGYLDIHIVDYSIDGGKKVKLERPAMTNSEIKESVDSIKEAGSGTKADKENIAKLETEFYKRFAAPLSSLFFLLLGFPLGIINRRSGKGSGFGISIIFIFIYFSLFLSAEAFAAKGGLSPFLAAWLPDFVILVLGLVVFTLKTTDISWKLIDWRKGRRVKTDRY